MSKANGLKNLCTLIGLQGRDAHFRHDFEHALGNGFAVAALDICRGLYICDPIKGTFVMCIPKRFESKIGVDRISAIADEQTVVVHFACLAGLYH